MLKLLFAPPYSDLAGEVVRRFDLNKRCFLIVPRHYSHECERKLCEVLGDSASSKAEVLSVDRLYSRVASEVGGAAERFLDDAGRLLIAYSAAQRVSSQMRVFGGELRRTEFLTEALRLIDELQSCRVAPSALMGAAETLGGDLGDRLRDLSLIAESYLAELEQRGSPRDRVSALIDLLDCGWAEGKSFAFFGYSEFTAQELELVRKLMGFADVTVALGCDCRLFNPAFGEDDPLYAYARTAEHLRRMAVDQGVKLEESIYDREDDGRPEELKYIAREFTAERGLCFQGQAGAVTLAEERSVWTECERAAAYILDTVRENDWRFRDFAVALPRGDEYLGALEAVFGSWGIPIFLDRTDSALDTPVLAALVAALDILRDGFATEDVLRYLKSGLSPLSFENCCQVENYAFTWKIGGRKWLSDWTGSPRGFSVEVNDRDAAVLERLNRSRQLLVAPFERFRERIRPGESYDAGEILHAFYDLLSDLRLDRRIAASARQYASAGELKTAGEYSQLWGKVCDLMDEFYELAGTEPMKFDEFSQLFELLLGGISVGVIPPALDGVPVGDMGRLRHRRPKALLLLGASAGAFPPVSAPMGLLDDRDREELAALDVGLEPSTRRLRWRSTDTAFSVLTLPSRRLYVSWSPTAEGGSPTPSPLILRLGEELGVGICPPEDNRRLLSAEAPALELALRAADGRGDGASRAALEYFTENGDNRELISRACAVAHGGRGPLSAEAADLLYGGSTKLTASRSDLFMDCAFSYFCRYGLGAKPRRRAELDAMESGILIHHVLENTVRKASETGLFDEDIGVYERYMARILSHIELYKYMNTRLGEAASGDPRTRQLIGRIESSLDRVVSSIMDEFASSSFRPTGFEVGFGVENGALGPLPVGEHGQLSGIIDRVDSWTNPEDGQQYYRVVDYKSGSKSFDYSDVYNGVSLQLPIYLHALRKFAEENGIPAEEAGAFYSPAADFFISGDRGMEDYKIVDKLHRKEQRSGVYLSDPVVMDAMEHGQLGRFLPTSSHYKLTKARFELLERHVERAMESVVRRISSGEIEAYPSVKPGGYCACDYCEFAAACKLDITNGHDSENLRRSISADRFWETLEGREADGNA